jgi:hypothetical protein
MSTLVDKAVEAKYWNGCIVIQMSSGIEIKFPVSENPRLSSGSDAQLNNIEISPYGLHWPDLDEDLSFRGLFEGNYGQYVHAQKSRCGKV